ncbi:hypothetical protein EXIGLDRAFT_760799 [Exidia glandulosa HHB12029]|uniref:BZIP domain-containing protein n=1 Tax=Exidia glandulosa HHB12029 TaxID=1314781 RepID=A0A165P3P6_EXIGL|nr:hypothetical protein EXIGLDRAFT_760799 [Exidia glandulosa HHB12029]
MVAVTRSARRLPAVRSSAPDYHLNSHTAPAISAPSENIYNHIGHHVRPGPLNQSRVPGTPIASNNAHPPASSLPASSRPRHASLTHLSKRLPAPSNFGNMAFRLPPPPSTSGQQNISNNSFAQPTLNNYLNLRNSYFDMISDNNNDQSTAAMADPAAPALVAPPVHSSSAATATFEPSPYMSDYGVDDGLRELLELLTPDRTPALGGAGMNDSPPEETPLFTPNLDMFGTPIIDSWTSPALGDADSFDAFPPLFNDALTGYADPATLTKKSTDTESMSIDLAQLYTIPKTPALTPASLPSAKRATAGNKAATGFRKGATPNTLVPLDAPTQTRAYLGASKTSRKEVPAAFQQKAKKRQHEEMLDDDELPDDIQDQIAAKRRLNTLAARRSRQRKAQTAMEMESRINDLSAQVEHLSNQLVTVSAERDAYKAQLGLF